MSVNQAVFILQAFYLDICTYVCSKLEKEVRAQGNVELWLGELLTLQQKSLHGVIREAAFVISEPTFELLKFIDEYIAQVNIIKMLIDRAYSCSMYINV